MCYLQQTMMATPLLHMPKLSMERATRAHRLPTELSLRPSIFWSCLVVCALSSNTAVSDVFFQDPKTELSATGPRISRTCLLAFRPALTLGGSQAPVLTLLTSGLKQISFSLKEGDRYDDIFLVQNNMRQKLAKDPFLVEQFLDSSAGKAIMSRKPFFITAKVAKTGEYVSSRYEPIDLDEVLAKVETYCPFDAERLMSKLSARENAERLLSLSDSDILLIRWALSRRFAGSLAKPEIRANLSSEDRGYLQKYAVQLDLPASRFLTFETAQKLKAEGSQLALAALASPQLVETSKVKLTIKHLMERAYKQLDDKDYSGARVTVTQAISLDKEFAPAYSFRGFAWYLEGLTKDPDNALAAYRQGFPDLDTAIRLDPNYAAVRRHRGNMIIATYKSLRSLRKPTNDILTRATDDLRDAVRLDPTSKLNLNALGEAYLLAGSYRLAIGSFYKAIERDQKYAAPYSGLCVAYRMLGRLSDARKNAQLAANLDSALRSKACLLTSL